MGLFILCSSRKITRSRDENGPYINRDASLASFFTLLGVRLAARLVYHLHPVIPGRHRCNSETLFRASRLFRDPCQLTLHPPKTAAAQVGSLASILVASPLDVIKTRIQGRDFNDPRGGMVIIRDLLKEEGMGGFFKGITPKAMTVAPKLIFSFSIAQYITKYFEDSFSQQAK
jgi:hypothetical protein